MALGMGLSKSDMERLRMLHKMETEEVLRQEYEDIVIPLELQLRDLRRTIVGYRAREADLEKDLEFTRYAAEDLMETIDKRYKKEKQEREQREAQLQAAYTRIRELQRRLAEFTGEEEEDVLDARSDVYAGNVDIVPMDSYRRGGEDYGRPPEYGSPASARSGPFQPMPMSSENPPLARSSQSSPRSPATIRTTRGSARWTRPRTPGAQSMPPGSPRGDAGLQQSMPPGLPRGDPSMQQQRQSPYGYAPSSPLGRGRGSTNGSYSNANNHPMVVGNPPPTPESTVMEDDNNHNNNNNNNSNNNGGNKSPPPTRGLWEKLTGKAAAPQPGATSRGGGVQERVDQRADQMVPAYVVVAEEPRDELASKFAQLGSSGSESSLAEEMMYSEGDMMGQPQSAVGLSSAELEAELARRKREEANAARKEKEQEETARKWREEAELARKRREEAELSRHKREQEEKERNITTVSGKYWVWPPAKPPASPRPSPETDPGTTKVASLIANLQAN